MQAMKLCVYVMTCDAGFAPNLFWGYCTLATCTPNHKRCDLKKGDWIVGHNTKAERNRLIYAMQLTEDPMTLDEYYHDRRFERKRPTQGTWQQRCGDNVYSLNDNGVYRQDNNAEYHRTFRLRRIDTYGDRVFVSKHFYYFGANPVLIPQRFVRLIKREQGVSYHYDGIVGRFVDWLEENHRRGRRSLPRDLCGGC